jgi:Spy/CpxP family protein refolding chaperone
VNTWKVILATMVIFGAGVVTGGLLVRHTSSPSHPPRGQAASRPLPPMSPSGLKMEVLRRVERDLDLTPEQRSQVDRIISASQERTKKLMEPVAPQIHAELQETKEAVRAVLTPEQRIRFDELLKQQQRPRDQKHSNSHPAEKAVPAGSSNAALPNP